MRRLVLPSILGLLCCIAASPARAQSDLSRVFPNGARQGAELTLTFGGASLPDEATLLVEGDGITPLGPFTKGVGKIRIAPDAAPGVRQMRLVGPKSATSPRPFAIGTLPELDEKEPNDTTAQAQPLAELPVTLNGALPTRPDMDLFRVTLKRGECLVVAGESRALGAPTNLLVRVRDAAGQELLSQMDYRTRDPLFGFTAMADGDYLVELQEVLNNYSNLTADYVYRVTFSKGPWLDSVFPPGAQRGATARLAFTGWNLGGKLGPSTVEADVAVPADAPARFPVAAGGAHNTLPLAVGSVPEQVEQERAGAGVGSSAGSSAPQSVTLPVTVSGRFGTRGDVDLYQFTTRASERLLLRVDARGSGSLADPVLYVRDAAGKTLAEVDDADGSPDPRLLWTVPADGVYTVVVRDVAAGSRGGPGFFYRLTLSPPTPELRLTTAAPTVVLKPGEKAEVSLTVTRSFLPQETAVTVEGLPDGVTAAPLVVPATPDGIAASEVKLVLTAGPGAKPGSSPLRILARSGSTPSVSATATASWVLSSDRSGTLATGNTERLLLLIPAP
ncbi:MAG TPA: PPC domain-containing protein [Armatimonadota bacterium]|nr:PPC domain-containing protein [Armatimonadota bacterium]